MFKIVFSKTALNQLRKCDVNLQSRLLKSLERSRIRPWKFVKKVVGVNLFRLKVGKYRIIMDIQKNNLIILVITINHRKKVYKK